MQDTSIKAGFIFFLLSVIPLFSIMSSWGIEFFNRVTIFIPVACGIISLIVSLYGKSGWIKFGLIVGNILSIGTWALLLFVAIFGFQAP